MVFLLLVIIIYFICCYGRKSIIFFEENFGFRCCLVVFDGLEFGFNNVISISGSWKIDVNSVCVGVNYNVGRNDRGGGVFFRVLVEKYYVIMIVKFFWSWSFFYFKIDYLGYMKFIDYFWNYVNCVKMLYF